MSSVPIPAYEWCYNSNMMFNPSIIQEWPIFKTLRDSTTSQFAATRP